MFRNHEQVILNQLFPKLRRFIFLPLDLSHFLHSNLLNYRTAAMTHRKGFEQRAISAVLEWPPSPPSEINHSQSISLPKRLLFPPRPPKMPSH